MKEIDLAFVGKLALGIVAFVAFVLASPWLLRAWNRLMSRLEARAAAAESGEEPVHVPVPGNQPPIGNQAPGPRREPSPALVALADTNEVRTGTDEWNVPVSRYLTDDEFLIFLATQRLRSGKYRLSANQITQVVGGKREEVLAVVRQVREPAPQFPPPTPEQEATRAALGLERNGHIL